MRKLFRRQGEQRKIRDKSDLIVKSNGQRNSELEKGINFYAEYLKHLDACSSGASQLSPSDEAHTQNSDLYDGKATFATTQSELLQKLEDAYQVKII